MRWVLVLVAGAAVGIGLVNIRLDVVRHRHEIRQLGREQVRLRRALCDQQISLSKLTTRASIHQAVVEQSLDLTDRTGSGPATLSAATGGSYR